MKKNDKLKKQIEIVNNAVHRILFNVKIPDLASEILRSLTFIDLHVISLACEKPDRILKEIKEYLHIPQTTLSSSVSKLEKLGLVKRIINRRDLRSYSIELTEKAKNIMEEHKRFDEEQAKRIIMMLDGKERDEFVAFLQKIISRF